MFSRIAAVTMLSVVVLAATGCSQVSSVLTPGPKIVTIEATVATPGAAVKGELPAGAPAGLPLWPGATVVDGSSSGTSYELVISATEAFDDVVAGLAKGFSDAGWEVARDTLGGSGERTAVLTVSRSTHQGLVTITEDTPETVTITYVISSME